MLRAIGQTGELVYPIGLGAMPLSVGERPLEAEAIRVLHAGFDAGVTFIDTADAYCHDNSEIGHNELLIAKALSEYAKRDKILVATKGGCTRPDGRWQTDGRPKHLRKACERSLQNLSVEQIFLYQLHAPSTGTPFETSLEALAELQSEGKIQHIGISNVSPEQLKSALKIVRVEAVQNRFNPLYLDSQQNGLIELCKQNDICFIAHSPLGGILNHRQAVSHTVFADLAEKHSCSPYQIILAWHLGVDTHILPIPGVSKIESILDSSKAASLQLDSADLEAIYSISC